MRKPVDEPPLRCCWWIFSRTSCPAVPDGDEIMAPVRELIGQSRFGLYVAAQDWHPEVHVSFASSHEGREPFETIELYGHLQTLWPDHCIQGTPGAPCIRTCRGRPSPP